jgi:hypothetical protein
MTSSPAMVTPTAASTSSINLYGLTTVPRLLRQRSRSVVFATPPPLPLISLPPDAEWEEFDTPTKTGFGYSLPHLEHLDEVDAAAGTARETVSPESARICRLLSDYMTQNEQFQTTRHSFGIDTRLIYKRSKETESVANFSSVACLSANSKFPDDISFAAAFESGNLDRAYRIVGRYYAVPSQLVSGGSSNKDGICGSTTTLSAAALGSAPPFTPPFAFFVATDLEYDLYCDKDVNTHGHVQWYFFRAVLPRDLCRRAADSGLKSVKVRFNIRNMLKKASLYNDGMLPAVFVERGSEISQRKWHHDGTNVCYFRNADTYRNHKTGKIQNFYTLSFVYEFILPSTSYSSSDTLAPVVAYFAHCFPYTYSRLQRYLLSLQKDPARTRHLKRRTLCKTIAGNNCDMLTITDFAQDDESTGVLRTGIVLTSRVHPGESNSSFVMHGILDFLTGSSLEARFLRHLFVFKIVPMLNPDGVIHGNYRCSLAGTDLNRRWINPSPDLHPTVFATKNMITSLHRTRTLSLYCDFHGHSRKKNIFLYGCRAFDTSSRAEAARVRFFPHILAKTSDAARGGYFSFTDCTFSVARSKKSTGRIVVWSECQTLHCFTMEASFFGVDPAGNGKRSSLIASHGSLSPPRHFTAVDLRSAGVRVCLALIPFAQMLNLQRPVTQPQQVVPASSPHSHLPKADAASLACSRNCDHAQQQQAEVLPIPVTPANETSAGVGAPVSRALQLTRCGQHQEGGTTDDVGDDSSCRPPPLFIKASSIGNITSTPEVQCSDRLEADDCPGSGGIDRGKSLAPAFSTGTFALSGEFGDLFSADGEMSSMMALLDQEDMLKEIEATLPENMHEGGNDDTDGSVGSESDPSGDDMEEEELARERPRTPAQVTNSARALDSLQPIPLPRKRPLLLRRNLSESRL